MKSFTPLRIRCVILCAAMVLAGGMSGCHSGKSKKRDEPVVEAPRAPVMGTADRLATQPPRTPAFDPYAPAVLPQAPAPTSTPARASSEPVEQNVTLKVKAEEAKTITQPVALDVKFAKQPTLEVPVSLSLRAPSEAERKIPVAVAFTVDSTAPITVPIRFQAEGGLQVPIGSRAVSGINGPGGDGASGGGNAATISGGGGDSMNAGAPRNNAVSYVYDPALIPFKLLAAIIGAAGLVGGILRTIQSRRNLKRAMQTGREWSQLSFDERVRMMEQQYQAMGAGEQTLMLFANVLWGILAAGLVPAVLVVRDHPLLVQISGSRPHILALFGFCLLAATVGAEVLVLVQRMFQRMLDGSGHEGHKTYSTASE